MKLRAKALYMSVGVQGLAAIIFALCGKLPLALWATFFTIWGWYAAEFHAKPEEK